MVLPDIIDQLREWENRFPVDEWKADDIHLWPLIRVSVGSSMLAARQVRGPEPSSLPSGVRYGGRLAHTLATAWRDRRATVSKIPKADALFLSHTANRELAEGTWYDRLFDPLADILEARGRSSVTLEQLHERTAYRLPRHRPSRFVEPAVVRARIAARLRNPRLALPDFEAWSDRVAAEAGVPAPERGRIARRAAEVQTLADYFAGTIDTVQPRAVFLSTWYTPSGMALCLAATKRGIPSVDLQHGLTPGNVAYDGWTRFPSGGYAIVPEVFWCWTDWDADPVRGWPDPVAHRHRPVVGGYPWATRWTTDRPHTQALAPTIEAIRNGEGIHVLVSLSWSWGLSDALKDVLRQAGSHITWWIRLHPVMERNHAEIARWCTRHLGARAHVDAPTRLPLPVLLRSADVHLTHSSTVIQEAIAEGVPSVAIDSRAQDIYPDAVTAGWLRRADDPLSILQAIDDRATNRPTGPPPYAYPPAAHTEATLMELIE